MARNAAKSELLVLFKVRESDDGMICIGIETFNKLMNILDKRGKKLHLQITFNDRCYAANIAEDLAREQIHWHWTHPTFFEETDEDERDWAELVEKYFG